MSALLRDEKLTTADIVNPPRPRAAAQTDSDVIDMRTGERVDVDGQQQAAFVDNQAQQTNALFADNELRNFRLRWNQVQTSFVDEPREAVAQADILVANVVKRIAEQFASEREQLEQQWEGGDNVNTEDLRQAFKRYRAFFDRLLAF